MNSSKEAFAKFAMWKKSNMAVSLTGVVNGFLIQSAQGAFTTVDEEKLLIAFVLDLERSLLSLEMADASFAIEDRRVVATLGGHSLVFEEVLPS